MAALESKKGIWFEQLPSQKKPQRPSTNGGVTWSSDVDFMTFGDAEAYENGEENDESN